MAISENIEKRYLISMIKDAMIEFRGALMSRTDPNGKEIINSISFERNLSVDELATLRTFRKSDENQPEPTDFEELSSQPMVLLSQPISSPIPPASLNPVSGTYKSIGADSCVIG